MAKLSPFSIACVACFGNSFALTGICWRAWKHNESDPTALISGVPYAVVLALTVLASSFIVFWGIYLMADYVDRNDE